MSSAAIVATSHAADGQALVDIHTPAHFGIGFLAGALGVEPHVAMVVFLGAKIAGQAMRAGMREAVFGRVHAESLGNELMDVTVEMLGLHLGKHMREQHTASQPVQSELVPATDQAAGFGAYYAPQPYIPISGLGAYYVDPVNVPIR